jgi:hydroxymethylglutaryl-CoA synthase
MKPADFSKVVFYAPDPRSPMALVKRLGLNPETQPQNPLSDVLGNTGTSLVLMLLVTALDESKPGDSMLLLSYGDGVDALLLRVTQKINHIKEQKVVKAYLDSKRMINDYPTYLLWQGLVHPDSEQVYYTKFQKNTAAPAMWRELKQIIGLHVVMCKACNAVQFPLQRVCAKCHGMGEFDEARLSDKKGTVFTFAMDCTSFYDFPTVIPIVDFDGGGRAEFYMTEKDPHQVQVGVPVEMTFREAIKGK